MQDRPRRPGRVVLRILYRNRPFAVRKALATVMAELAGLGLTEEECCRVELVLAEVLNNVAEHAYGDAPGGLVELRVQRHDRHLRFGVIDGGRPMPGGATPAPAVPPAGTCAADLPEGGFGWFLIRTLARNIEYERQGARNRLSFEIDFGRAIPGS